MPNDRPQPRRNDSRPPGARGPRSFDRPRRDGEKDGKSGSYSPKEGGFSRKFQRRKFCRFSADKVEFIDYKNYRVLREMVTERGKIKPRGQTGTTAKFQRMLSRAIKRARQMALLSPTKN